MKTRHLIAFLPLLLNACSGNDTTQQLKHRLVGGPKQ